MKRKHSEVLVIGLMLASLPAYRPWNIGFWLAQLIINAFYDSIPNNWEITLAQQLQPIATFSPYSNPKSMHPKFGSYSSMD